MKKEFKGTKGEWYHEFTSLSQFSPNGHSIIKAGKVGTPVAVLPMPIGGVNSKERNISNAQLIAAAPDMLEALMIVNDDIERGPVRYSYQEKMEIVKKTINKALGL